MASGIMFVFMEITGIHEGNPSARDEKLFYDYVKRVNELADRQSGKIDLEQLKVDVDRLNKRHRNSNISLSIYQGKELLYSSSPLAKGPILDMALSQDSSSNSRSHMFVIDNIAVYRINTGDYSIILTDTNFYSYKVEHHEDLPISFISIGIIVFLFGITIILLTNRFLTQFVFKSITTPLDTLEYGVHQIRDGNLDYHINYAGKDEFAGICSDFNEMAQRLLDSVNTRQKDEANRKELIAGISHDLRTPLTSIKAYVEGLEKGLAATPENQKRYLDTIKNKTNDLEHIVNQLFLFSKLDIGEFPLYVEPVNIGQELSNMIANLSEEYEKKGLNITLLQTVQTVQTVQNVFVQADIVQLRNAVINILENSVKYKNKAHGEMKITCKTDDDYVKVILADNGPGVPCEALEKLFDVFYRSDPSRSNPSKGSGLGLAITAKILERLGGSIWAENEPEGGLAIVMKLPKTPGGDSVEKNPNS
jgi:signal transduction histidine kinase